MSVVALHVFLVNRISLLRERVNQKLIDARKLIDEAKDARYDFSKIVASRKLIDSALEDNNEIKRLEARLSRFVA